MMLDVEVVSYLEKICPTSESFHVLVQQFIDSLLKWQSEFPTLDPSQHDHALHTLYGRCGSMGAIELAACLNRLRRADIVLSQASSIELHDLIRQSIAEYQGILSHR